MGTESRSRDHRLPALPVKPADPHGDGLPALRSGETIPDMLSFQIEQLKQRPQRSGEVWQGALVRLPKWVRGEPGERPYRLCLPMWLAVNTDKVGRGELARSEEGGDTRLWDALIAFANDEQIGGYRPGRVELADADVAERFEPALRQAGIEVVRRDTLPELDQAMAEMVEHMRGGPAPPGWDTAEGVDVERMRAYADAAAAFFHATPWQHLSNEDLLVIESPAPPAEMRCATVLGAGGQIFGLGFFDSPEQKWALYRAEDPKEVFARGDRGSWSFLACDLTELPLPDADLWVEQDLAVADEQSYPCVLGHHPDRSARRPDADRLAFVEALLRALAATTEQQIDDGRWSLDVVTADGPVTVTLALPDLLDPPDHRQWMQRGFEPDRRAMDRMHAQMGRFLEGRQASSIDEINELIQAEFVGKQIDPDRFPPRTPLEQAQELCYQAFDTHGRRRVQLAREALSVCIECTDAHVILGECAHDVEQAMEHFAAGVAAGERALGPQRFEQDAGNFWGQHDTRPYMRARFGLARCLEACDRLEEAAEHYRELLRLNPDDNQGVRYRYLPVLLRLGWDREAAQYLAASDEDSAQWCYTRALLAYRLGGDTQRARKELDKAFKTNAYLPEVLLQDDAPDVMPSSYAPGSIEEAIICAEVLGEAFATSAGALDWLAARWQHRRPGRDSRAGKPKRRKRRSR